MTATRWIFRGDAMSDYYLCDTCHLKIKDLGEYVLCQHTWPCAPKKVMHDHNGRGGKRYKEPTQVCEHYEPRRK